MFLWNHESPVSTVQCMPVGYAPEVCGCRLVFERQRCVITDMRTELHVLEITQQFAPTMVKSTPPLLLPNQSRFQLDCTSIIRCGSSLILLTFNQVNFAHCNHSCWHTHTHAMAINMEQEVSRGFNKHLFPSIMKYVPVTLKYCLSPNMVVIWCLPFESCMELVFEICWRMGILGCIVSSVSLNHGFSGLFNSRHHQRWPASWRSSIN